MIMGAEICLFPLELKAAIKTVLSEIREYFIWESCLSCTQLYEIETKRICLFKKRKMSNFLRTICLSTAENL